jgi:hypothetical protein
MNNLKHLLVGAGLAIATACAVTGTVSAASPHYVLLKFALPPGGSRSIPLPADQIPIRVAVSATLRNGGTQTPSELMTAVVNTDPSSHQLTWIGTNSDGTQSAGTTLGPSLIASIDHGNDTLSAQAPGPKAPHGSLIVAQSATRSIKEAYYIVTLVY